VITFLKAVCQQLSWTFDKINVYGLVPHCMQPSPDGSLNVNVAAHRWKMTTVLDGGRPCKATMDDYCQAVTILVMGDHDWRSCW